MKKLIVLATMAMFTLATQAQIVSSRSSRITRTERVSTPSIYIDLGVGTYTGDVEDTGVGVDLGFRWNKMFSPNIGWDILKISAQTDTKNFTESLDVQAKTGIRGVSPVVFGNSTIYANVAAGYGYYTDIEEGGLVWEVGAGINFNPHVSLGVVYNSHNYSIKDYDINVGLISLRLSYGF